MTDIHRSKAGEVATVSLVGRFDFKAGTAFVEATSRAIAEFGVRELVIDLTQVDYIDSSGLGALLVLRDRAGHAGQVVILAGADGAAHETLRIAKLDRLFTVR